MLCLLSKGDLPRNSKEMNKLLRAYKDETVLKIIEERDLLLSNERAK